VKGANPAAGFRSALLLWPFLAGAVITAGLVAAIMAEFAQVRHCTVLSRFGLQGLWTCAAQGDTGASRSANLPGQVRMRNDFRAERTIGAGRGAVGQSGRDRRAGKTHPLDIRGEGDL